MGSWSTPSCPRDSSALQLGSYHEVDIHRCPECQGVLVGQWRLESLLTRMSADLMETVSLDVSLAPLEDRGGGILCPLCHGVTEHYGYMGANEVMIDRCPKCNQIWFDSDELGAASVLYTRTRKRLEFRLLQRTQERLESTAVLQGRRLGRSTAQALAAGFVLGKTV